MHKKLFPAFIALVSAYSSARAMNFGQALENMHRTSTASKKSHRHQNAYKSDSDENNTDTSAKGASKTSFITHIGLLVAGFFSPTKQ